MAHPLNGRWQLVSSSNFEPYMKATGVSDENIAKGKVLLEKTGDGGLVEEYVVDTAAKTAKRSLFVGGQLQKESPPIPFDKEIDGPGLDGRQLKFSLKMDGPNKMIRTDKGQNFEAQTAIEVSGDSLTATLTCGSVTCVRKYKKL